MATRRVAGAAWFYLMVLPARSASADRPGPTQGHSRSRSEAKNSGVVPQFHNFRNELPTLPDFTPSFRNELPTLQTPISIAPFYTVLEFEGNATGL